MLPADGPVAWTTHTDLAEATAAILADEGRFEGPTPSLTASRALSFDDLAAIATEVTGRTCTRSTAPEAGFRDHLVAQGVPAHYADQVLGIFAAARAGEFSTPDPTPGTLLGREPAGMREVLGEALGQPPSERPTAGCSGRPVRAAEAVGGSGAVLARHPAPGSPRPLSSPARSVTIRS
ncbi:Rossmann-fold NAD(P)-binding domain-containing protein [Streptomyces salinarius]|uniref:hypothetical protein n=1 Tax=Streptomyces salinarius TaxID=2762598 RepID=UPI0013DCD172|nr:hypothetical protein [Streptomyces salinarius]